MIEKINMVTIIRNPIGKPISGSCANTTGSSVNPRSAATSVNSIERIEAPITPTAIYAKVVSNWGLFDFSAIL